MTASDSNHPLRVAMVCSSTIWAGTEKWALQASEGLAQRGHAVTFVARMPELFKQHLSPDGAGEKSSFSYSTGESERRNEIQFKRLPLANDADLYSSFRLAWWLKHNADVVILTRVRDYWLGGFAARLSGVPALLRLGVIRRLRDDYWRDRLRYGRFPGRILVNAKAISDELEKTLWIDPRDIHVIYNGVDTPGPLQLEDRATLRRELAISEEEILFAGAGRFGAEKRWDWLVDAVATIRAEGLPVRAVIFGEGSERTRLLDKVRKKGLETAVALPGHVDSADRYLAAADVAVMASRAEGISNSMLEAMGYATPVVAAIAGGAAEKLTSEQDLLLVEQNNYEGFINALRRMAADAELRSRLGQQGYETVKREFSWDRMTRELEELLFGMAGKKLGHHAER